MAEDVLSATQSWMTPYLVEAADSGEAAPRLVGSKSFNKTRIIDSFDVRGLSALDVGCSDGVYSLYLARNGASKVHGIDLDPVRTDRATQVASALGFSNVSFAHQSVYDLVQAGDGSRFDFTIAWGFLHRVPDPFNLLLDLGLVSNTLSLEWRAPALLPKGLAVAIHNGTGSFEWKNFNNADAGMRSGAIAEGVKSGNLADFWRISPAVVTGILKRMGFSEFDLEIVKQESGLRTLPQALARLGAAIFRKDGDQIPWSFSNRVHLLARRSDTVPVPRKGTDKTFRPAPFDGRFMKR